MDVYSFGLIMWEIFFECVPFDNDVTECTKYVLQQNTRPKITLQDQEEDGARSVTDPVAKMIRRCWAQEPSERTSFNNIVEMLTKELSFYQASNFVRSSFAPSQRSDEDQ